MKKKKKRSSIPFLAGMAVCVLVLCFSIYKIADILLEYKAGADEYEELLKYVNAEAPAPEDFPEETMELPEGEELPEEPVEEVQRVALEELREKNPDTAAWIEVPGTRINYPVMHRDDNSYYLNHTFLERVNSAGSIFVETLNAPDFSDLHTIIYGHNMKNGTMFAELKEYKSPTFLVEHPLIYLDLDDGTHYYEIFSCYEAEADSDSYTIGFAPNEEYASYLQTIKDRSLYDTGVEVSADDQIITLSTCSKSSEKRFLVHAKRVG